MPPKKAVKEEKIILGRPGNSLKSGIVRELDRIVNCVLDYNTNKLIRLVWLMLVNRRSSKPSQSARLVTQPYVHDLLVDTSNDCQLMIFT